MKKAIWINLILVVLFVTSSCSNVSKEKLTAQIRSEIDIELAKTAAANDISYTILSFDLIHKSGNEYSGILKTIENSEEFTYQVDVTVDGDSYMWRIVQ
jgi:hypothetical protein